MWSQKFCRVGASEGSFSACEYSHYGLTRPQQTVSLLSASLVFPQQDVDPRAGRDVRCIHPTEERVWRQVSQPGVIFKGLLLSCFCRLALRCASGRWSAPRLGSVGARKWQLPWCPPIHHRKSQWEGNGLPVVPSSIVTSDPKPCHKTVKYSLEAPYGHQVCVFTCQGTQGARVYCPVTPLATLSVHLIPSSAQKTYVLRSRERWCRILRSASLWIVARPPCSFPEPSLCGAWELTRPAFCTV